MTVINSRANVVDTYGIGYWSFPLPECCVKKKSAK